MAHVNTAGGPWIELAQTDASGDSFFLHTAAWQTTNPLVLLKAAPREGENWQIPGDAPGYVPLRRRDGQAQRTLMLNVTGSHAADGSAYGDVRDGLEENLIELATLSTLSNDADASLLDVTLHARSGDLTGKLQVELVDWDDQAMINEFGLARATIDVTLYLGGLS